MNILEENLKNLKNFLNNSSSNLNNKKEKINNNKNINNNNSIINYNTNINNNYTSINNNKNYNQTENKNQIVFPNLKKKSKIRSLSVTNVKIVEDPYYKKNYSNISPKNSNLKNNNNNNNYYLNVDRKKIKSISHKLNSFYNKKHSINNNNNNLIKKEIEKKLFKNKIEKRNKNFLINRNSISVTDRKKIKSISKSKNLFFNNLRENKHLSNKKFNLINSYYNQINFNKEKISSYSNQFQNIQKLFVNNLKGLYLNKSGDKLKCNKSMTFMIKKQKPKKTILEKLINNNNNENSLKKAIFWQNLKWLWFNKNIFIEQIINNYFDYKWFFNDGKLITKEICEEFFILREINDKNFINNFFILFDFNKNGFINFTFAVNILIATSNNSYEEKIKKILDILKNEKNFVNFNVFLEIFNNIFLPFDKKLLINKLKKDLNIEKQKKFDLNYFYLEDFLNKTEIKKILKKYFVKFNEIEENVEKEMGIAFMDLKKRLLNNNQFAKSIIKKQTEKFENIINKLINIYNFKFLHKEIFNNNEFIVFNNNNNNNESKKNSYFQNYIKEFENKLN